jgi:hypothetical protein
MRTWTTEDRAYYEQHLREAMAALDAASDAIVVAEASTPCACRSLVTASTSLSSSPNFPDIGKNVEG